LTVLVTTRSFFRQSDSVGSCAVRNPRDASAICICTRQLKLGRMRDTLPERLILAREQHLSHAASLELVLADEATRRHPLGVSRCSED
jgi:hypothetical protein